MHKCCSGRMILLYVHPKGRNRFRNTHTHTKKFQNIIPFETYPLDARNVPNKKKTLQKPKSHWSKLNALTNEIQ